MQILDAARPRSLARAIYEQMKGTRFERYVAHPARGSMHNYGVVVDMTIVDAATPLGAFNVLRCEQSTVKLGYLLGKSFKTVGAVIKKMSLRYLNHHSFHVREVPQKGGQQKQPWAKQLI